jgi:GAF domain-containing protein
MPRLIGNQALLQAIALAYGSGDKTLQQATDEALEALIGAVGCDRVSLWRFEAQPHERGLRCFVSKVAGQPSRHESTLLLEAQYREYFAALVANGMFVTADAMNEPALVAMRGAYLLANGIVALLDVPVLINGRAYGIVCCEKRGGRQHWSAHDTRVARETVVRAGLLIATRSILKLDTIESVPMAPL